MTFVIHFAVFVGASEGSRTRSGGNVPTSPGTAPGQIGSTSGFSSAMDGETAQIKRSRTATDVIRLISDPFRGVGVARKSARSSKNRRPTRRGPGAAGWPGEAWHRARAVLYSATGQPRCDRPFDGMSFLAFFLCGIHFVSFYSIANNSVTPVRRNPALFFIGLVLLHPGSPRTSTRRIPTASQAR